MVVGIEKSYIDAPGILRIEPWEVIPEWRLDSGQRSIPSSPHTHIRHKKYGTQLLVTIPNKYFLICSSMGMAFTQRKAQYQLRRCHFYKVSP